MMKGVALLLLVIVMLVFSGCVMQQPVLAGEPTREPVLATPTAKPLPAQEPQPSADAPQNNLDAAGKKIEGDDHFLQYLSFRDIRVYEYAGGTLMDGICENTYEEALTGAFEIHFFDEDDQLVAKAMVYTRDGDSLYESGENVIFAEIDTDSDIQMMRFELVMQQRVWPESMMVTIIE